MQNPDAIQSKITLSCLFPNLNNKLPRIDRTSCCCVSLKFMVLLQWRFCAILSIIRNKKIGGRNFSALDDLEVVFIRGRHSRYLDCVNVRSLTRVNLNWIGLENNFGRWDWMVIGWVVSFEVRSSDSFKSFSFKNSTFDDGIPMHHHGKPMAIRRLCKTTCGKLGIGRCAHLKNKTSLTT